MVSHFDGLGALDRWWQVVSALESAPLFNSNLVASFLLAESAPIKNGFYVRQCQPRTDRACSGGPNTTVS